MSIAAGTNLLISQSGLILPLLFSDTKNRRRDKEGADEEEADEADGEEAEKADGKYATFKINFILIDAQQNLISKTKQ